MRFLWPDMLWLLLAVPLLVAGYFFILRRRKRSAIRYSSLILVREAVRGQRFRRHIPPALFLVAMAAAIVAIARPTASVVLPSQYMTIALAMDVSRSMQATDVEPTRISAAQVAARSFIEELPRYDLPEINENGDIIIRRIDPHVSPEQPRPPVSPEKGVEL